MAKTLTAPATTTAPPINVREYEVIMEGWPRKRIQSVSIAAAELEYRRLLQLRRPGLPIVVTDLTSQRERNNGLTDAEVKQRKQQDAADAEAARLKAQQLSDAEKAKVKAQRAAEENAAELRRKAKELTDAADVITASSGANANVNTSAHNAPDAPKGSVPQKPQQETKP
jgi:hypothetical protein